MRAVGPWVLILLQGCLPFALPPGKLTLGAGPRYYGRDFRGPGSASGNEVSQQLRASLHPLGLVRSLHGRPLDFGLGYSLEQDMGDDPVAIGGPFLDLAYFPWHSAGGFRLGTIVSPLLITTGPSKMSAGPNAGVDLRLELEWTGFSGPMDISTEDGQSTPRSKDDSVVLGVAYGEWAIGAWAAGGYRSIGGSDIWNAWFGITVRWPSVAGIICCLDISD